MRASNFNLDRYLARIGFEGKPAANIDTVRQIMRSQLFTVPFENLDVQAGKIISFVPEEIVDKIVNRRRGGYCYEVNGLFAMALEALGIPYQFVAARPMFYPVRRPKTHMAVVVSLNGELWLCDLGFGSYGLRAPILLTDGVNEARQDADVFRLSHDTCGNYLLQALCEGEWTNQFEFNLSPQEWIDFAPANYLNSTHPDAIFVQKVLTVLHTPEGRKILLGDILKKIEHGVVSRSTIQPEHLSAVLQAEFGLAN